MRYSPALNFIQLLLTLFFFSFDVSLPVQNSTLIECLKTNGVAEEDIITRNLTSHKYNQLNFQWNTCKGIVYPEIYVTPRNSSNVQAAIICSRLFNIRIVAKSGGHSYIKHGFGDNSSLIVDLVHLNSININTSEDTAVVGAGNRQGRLYYHLWLNGYTGAIGFCPAVGIAGFSLGGGYGLLSRSVGLAADNVVEFEMVTANGTLLTVNNNSHPDLYFALRGAGGGNFGIVTNLKLKIYPSPTFVITATYIYSLEENFVEFLRGWQKHVSSLELDRTIMFAARFEGSTIRFHVMKVEYDTSPEGGISAVQKILDDFPPVLNQSTINFDVHSYDQYLVNIIAQWHGYPYVEHPSDLANITDYPTQWKQMVSMFVGKVLNDTEIFEFHIVLRQILTQSAVILFEHFGADSKMTEVTPTETAFLHRGPQAMYMMQVAHVLRDAYEADPEAVFLLRQFFRETERILEHRHSYQNYLDEGMTDYLQRYYGQNVGRLMQIKAAVDPDNVFHHPLSIPTSLRGELESLHFPVLLLLMIYYTYNSQRHC